MGIMQDLRAILLRAGVKPEDLEGSEEILKEGKQFAGNPKNYADLDSPDGKAWAKAKDLVKRHLDMDLPGDPKPGGKNPPPPPKEQPKTGMREKAKQQAASKLDRDLQDRQSGEGIDDIDGKVPPMGVPGETEEERKKRILKDLDKWSGSK
jgi:hypothetical protein